MLLSAAADILHLEAPVTDCHLTRVGTDSRRIETGELFVALRGEHFNGHDFVGQAFMQGAAAAMVDTRWMSAQTIVQQPLLVVDDTRLALGRLAAGWRARFTLPVLGITGSNGKTTVKDMCTAILRTHFARQGLDDHAVLATQGNLNNDIGLPLTLLSLNEKHRAAVIEMGMNHPGEIAALTRILNPTVAVINNAQRAHLQGVGSLADVAKAKGEIFAGLGAQGVAVFNADDPHTAYWRELNRDRHQVITFGLTQTADVGGQFTLQGLKCALTLRCPAGTRDIRLQVAGEHNVCNALAAAAACLAIAISLDDIADGLESFTGVSGRLRPVPLPNGTLLLDDTYNANPDSVRAGVDVLMQLQVSGRKILVLGDMGEVGTGAQALHEEMGVYARNHGVSALYAVGPLSAAAVQGFGAAARHFKDKSALVQALQCELAADAALLVKGSRFMRMEQVVQALQTPAAIPQQHTGNG